MADSESLLTLVKSFLTAANEYDAEKVLTMFNDNAGFELVGLYRVEGKEQIRAVFEYDAGVHTKLELLNVQAEGDTLKGWLVERNDRLAAIGFDKLDYPFCALTFRDGRIQNFSAKADESALKKIMETWQGFLPWVTQKYPADRKKLFTPEGRIMYNRQNGERVVKLLKEWKKGG